MKKAVLSTLLMVLTAASAHAGSSVTTLACSSESGRTVISGILPGQGEVDVRLNVSVASDMIVYSSEHNMAEGDVQLSKNSVLITVKNQSTSMKITASGADVKLNHSNNGTKGSFVGSLTGTHPSTYEQIQEPIKVRCFVSDEI